jgi:uncharacterized protein YeaO (DUF488 family)
MLKTKSVHSPIDRTGDGLRILATRVRGRGLPKDRYDVWMANLGPSEALLRAYRTEPNWPHFVREYRREMLGEGEHDRRNRVIRNHGQKFTLRLIKQLAQRGNVTLLCHCAEREKHCHRHVLRRLIEKV